MEATLGTKSPQSERCEGFLFLASPHKLGLRSLSCSYKKPFLIAQLAPCRGADNGALRWVRRVPVLEISESVVQRDGIRNLLADVVLQHRSKVWRECRYTYRVSFTS